MISNGAAPCAAPFFLAIDILAEGQSRKDIRKGG